MCVPVLDPTCIPETMLDAASQGILKTIADGLGQFVATLVKNVVTGWLTIPSPRVASSTDAALQGETIGAVAQLRAHTWWLAAALAVGSLLVAAAKIAVNRNGREAADVGRSMLHLVVLSGLGVPIVLLLTEIGDIYSTWILNSAADGQLEQRITKLTVVSSPALATSLPLIAVTICYFLMAFIFMVQIMLMFGRAVGLVILTGVLPVLAAGGMVGRATQSRDKGLAWLIVFVLYKPTAATVYAAGFWLIGEGTTLNDVLAGMMTFLIALVALPALMRLIVPMVDRMSAGAGSGAMAGLATGTSVATGAVAVGGALIGGRRSGGAAGSGGSPATGSAPANTMAPAAGLPTDVIQEGRRRVQEATDAPRRVATTIGEHGATGAGGAA